MVNSGRARLDKIKAVIQNMNSIALDDLNNEQLKKLDKLQSELNSLDLLKNGEWDEGHDNQLNNVQTKFENLKASVMN
jgi:hypothetical protein